MHRRTLLLQSLAAGALGVHGWARAQSGPPMRILVGSSAGGQTDLFARTLASAIQKRTGANVIVDNKTGGGGVIAAQTLTGSPPDGQTLLLITLGHVVIPHLTKKPAYNALTDFAPVASIAHGASLLVLGEGVPAKDFASFIAYAKAHPGKLTYGSAGIGSPQHLATEHMKAALGLDILHVPYRGAAPATLALRSGEISLMILDLANADPLLKEGKARAVAETGLIPVQGYEKLPKIADLSPGFDTSFWMGIVAPKGTPDAKLTALHKLIGEIAGDELRERETVAGLQPFVTSRPEFAAFMAQEEKTWSAIIRKNNITVD